MDDTLFLEADFVKSGFYEVDNYFQKHFKIKGFFANAWKRFSQGQRNNIFDKVLVDLNFHDNNLKFVQELVSIYRSHKPNIELLDDAKWALDFLNSSYPLALLSDGYLYTQRNKINALGINQYFDRIYLTDYWGKENWKPSSYVFNIVQKDFEASDSFVYIADNPQKDFIATNKIGWQSIHIKRNAGIYSGISTPANGKPNIIINSLHELKDILPL